jgi:uncharacterized protein
LIAEPGSAAAAVAWNGADSVASNRILYPEARAALAAAHRAKRVQPRGYAGRKKTLEELWLQMDIIEVTASLGKTAGDLSELHALRGYDAMHLAAALLVGADALVSADSDLLAAARAVGLPTVDARI